MRSSAWAKRARASGSRSRTTRLSRKWPSKLNQIKAESGAEAVATAGGTTRTDDWARRRFLNQFGTPNGFHNALLCWIPTFMAETCVAGWSPFETDLGAAKCLILWGMNPGAPPRWAACTATPTCRRPA